MPDEIELTENLTPSDEPEVEGFTIISTSRSNIKNSSFGGIGASDFLMKPPSRARGEATAGLNEQPGGTDGVSGAIGEPG
jgi:hypothetical protein